MSQSLNIHAYMKGHFPPPSQRSMPYILSQLPTNISHCSLCNTDYYVISCHIKRYSLPPDSFSFSLSCSFRRSLGENIHERPPHFPPPHTLDSAFSQKHFDFRFCICICICCFFGFFLNGFFLKFVLLFFLFCCFPFPLSSRFFVFDF